MAFDFPSSPADGQVFYPVTAFGSGPIWRYNAARGAWKRNAGTALSQNILVNGAFQISQQNGNTAGTASNYFTADQFENFPGAASMTFQRIAAATPRGSQYRSRAKVTATASLNTSSIQQTLEGNRLIGLAYGTANAKYSILRFGINAPAGNYSAGIRGYFNSASFVIPFTIANAGVDTEFSFVVPACTGLGTWATDNQIGARVSINFSDGGGGSTTPLVWSANNLNSLKGQTNLTDTLNAQMDVFDIGWHPDPNMTGVAPEFQDPHVEDDLLDCLRYWYPGYRFDGVVNSATNGYGWCSNYVPMRAAPVFTLVGSAFRCYDMSVAPNITSISNYITSPEASSLLVTAAAAGMSLGRPLKTLVDGQLANYIAVNARL